MKNLLTVHPQQYQGHKPHGYYIVFFNQFNFQLYFRSDQTWDDKQMEWYDDVKYFFNLRVFDIKNSTVYSIGTFKEWIKKYSKRLNPKWHIEVRKLRKEILDLRQHASDVCNDPMNGNYVN